MVECIVERRGVQPLYSYISIAPFLLLQLVRVLVLVVVVVVGYSLGSGLLWGGYFKIRVMLTECFWKCFGR